MPGSGSAMPPPLLRESGHQSKIEMFRKAGIHVAESFSEIADMAKRYV
jgi:succinyl-CoA synthetase alpha subunit